MAKIRAKQNAARPKQDKESSRRPNRIAKQPETLPELGGGDGPIRLPYFTRRLDWTQALV
jgi:hypothetical protein